MPLITRGDGVKIPDVNQAVISTSVDVFDEQGVNIGYMSQLTRTDTRNTFRVRHLDSQDAGRVIEQVPSPEDNALSANGLSLYDIGVVKKSLIHRLAGVNGQRFRSLNSQFIPFVVREEWTHPSSPGQFGQTLYLGCMLTNFTRPVNIGTAQIAESANVVPSWVE